MTRIGIAVKGARASVSEKVGLLTTGMVGAVARFSFDEVWSGLQKTAVFRCGGVIRDVLGWDGDTVQIPVEVLGQGEHLYIGVEGRNADGTVVIPTVWVDGGTVLAGANASGDPSADPGLEVWAQILAKQGDLADLKTVDKSSLVAAVNEALKSGGGAVDEATVERLVEEYLQENLPTAEQETDATLTLEGVPADAKVTGSNIRAIENKLLATEKVALAAIPAPATATVGQTIRVSEVDEDGKPVSWECVDMSSGGSSTPGADGEDGGYYAPTVTQDEAGTATISWAASQEGMPEVAEQTVTLPVGPQGPQGDVGATGPQGPVGSDASVTASNVEAALGYTPANEADVKSLSARMDAFASLGEGSTTGDAELVDARVDINGKTWPNAGGHIRGITKKIVEACCDEVTVEGSNYNLLKVSEVSFSTRLQDDVEGTVSSTSGNAVTGWIPVEYGKYYAMSVLYDGSRTTQPGGAGSQYTRMNAQKSDGTILVYNRGSIPIASDVEHSKQVLEIEYEDIVAVRIHFNVNAQDISTAELLKAYEPMIVVGDTAEEAYQNAVDLEYIDGDADAEAEVGYSLKHDETKADKTETAELRERLIGSMEIPTDGALVGTMVAKDLAISSGTAVNTSYSHGVVSDYIPCMAGSTITVDSSDYAFQVMEYAVKDAPEVYSGVLEYGTTYTVTQDGYVRICIRYVDTTLSADTGLFEHVIADISGYYDLSEFAKKTADPTTSPYYRNVDFGMVPWSYYHGVGADYEAEGFGKDTLYAAFIEAWKSLVAGHSSYVTETELGAASDGQMLYLYDFSPVRPTNQKTPIPKIIITAGQHGWEKADVYGLFYFVRDLLGSWNQHPALEYLRNHVELMVVPVVNPYGFDNFCYKNGNGVNINRNYDSNWVLVEDAESQQYGGTEPFDQPESQIVRDLILGNEDALMVVDFHTCSSDVAASYDMMTYYGVCASTDSYYGRMQDVAAHQLSAASANFDMDYELGQPDTIMGYVNMNPGNGILRSWATDNGFIGVLVEGFTGFPGRTAFSGDVLKANEEIIANYLVTALYYLSR